MTMPRPRWARRAAAAIAAPLLLTVHAPAADATASVDECWNQKAVPVDGYAPDMPTGDQPTNLRYAFTYPDAAHGGTNRACSLRVNFYAKYGPSGQTADLVAVAISFTYKAAPSRRIVDNITNNVPNKAQLIQVQDLEVVVIPPIGTATDPDLASCWSNATKCSDQSDDLHYTYP
ncbi:hypothetical protein [Streptosporangium sp. NPDC000239]|uniref:hypothetical protein n=1 Tax=unclassified Streptosporangium TaxID=2632669 RepID=UPI0033202C1C